MPDRSRYIVVAAMVAFMYYYFLEPVSLIVSSPRKNISKTDRDPQVRLRVFALGDIHGDYKTAISLLERGGIVDSEGNWVAGTDVFVQTVCVVEMLE